MAGSSESTKQKVYEYLLQRTGPMPTVREICEALGYRSTSTVFRALHALQGEGLLTVAEGKRRNIALVSQFREVRVPLYKTRKQAVAEDPDGVETYLCFSLPEAETGELFAVRLERGQPGVSAIALIERGRKKEDGTVSNSRLIAVYELHI